MVIIFDHLAAPWSWADVRGTAPQFCGPKLIDTGHGCSDRRVRFGHSTTRRRGGRRPPPREDPAQRRHALAGGFDAPPAPALSSAGDDSRPRHGILDRKIAARLFRRRPRPVEARIMPDSYVSSMGSALPRPHNHQLRTAIWLGVKWAANTPVRKARTPVHAPSKGGSIGRPSSLASSSLCVFQTCGFSLHSMPTAT